MMDKQGKKKDNKPNYYDERWYENSFVGESLGCLIDLAFLGCMVPTLIFLFAMIGSIGLVHRLKPHGNNIAFIRAGSPSSQRRRRLVLPRLQPTARSTRMAVWASMTGRWV